MTALNVSNNIEIAQTAHNRYCDQLRFCGNKLDDCSAKDEKNDGRQEEMNKASIKIIKRKDAEAAADVKSQNSCKTKSAAAMSGEKVERSLRRKMAETVSNWISERKENNRTKEISAIRKLFGDESLLSKTA